MFNRLYSIKYDVTLNITRKESIQSRSVTRQGIINCTKYIIARSKNRAIQELRKLYGEDQPVNIKEIKITSLWKPLVINKDLYK